MFPTVSGKNLDNEVFTLPHDFGSPYNMVQLAFTQEQQFDVNTWSPFLTKLRADYPAISTYELPTIKPYTLFERTIIDYWMRMAIPDRQIRATTITLYLDVPTFLQALKLPNQQSIYTLVVDREGQIYWRGMGCYTPELGIQLRAVVDSLV